MGYRFGETTYDISVEQAPADAGPGSPACRVSVDGVAQPDGAAHLVDDRAPHRVVVEARAARD